MTAKELKELTGAKNKYDAMSILYGRIEKRTWKFQGYTVNPSGIDYRKQSVHFCLIEKASDYLNKPHETGAIFKRIIIDIEDAIDCVSGKLDSIYS